MYLAPLVGATRFNGAASVIEAEATCCVASTARTPPGFNGAASVIEAEEKASCKKIRSFQCFNGAASVIEAEDPMPVGRRRAPSASTGPPR